ncbi:MAG: class I SAM-dependent methyltransferase [Chitinophagaceae bacterium]|nr:class I SAM-dependent methyltransferase [Chitinophagaceae bacterium]
MDRYKETFDTWNKVASLYQDKFMDLNLYDHTYDYIIDNLSPDQVKILELGCGPGNISKYLLSKRPDFDLFGIDIAPNMIELSKLNNPNAQFAVMDCRQIDQLDSAYDAIIVGFCLPYLSLSESRQLISNAERLLNDHGLIYLSFVEGEPDKSGYITGSGGRVYFHYHLMSDLKAHLTKTNFDEIKTFQVKYKTSETEFDIHTILIGKKKNSLHRKSN